MLAYKRGTDLKRFCLQIRSSYGYSFRLEGQYTIFATHCDIARDAQLPKQKLEKQKLDQTKIKTNNVIDSKCLFFLGSNLILSSIAVHQIAYSLPLIQFVI